MVGRSSFFAIVAPLAADLTQTKNGGFPGNQSPPPPKSSDTPAAAKSSRGAPLHVPVHVFVRIPRSTT